MAVRARGQTDQPDDSFFATRIFGPKALDHFQAESAALAGSLATQSDGTRKRVARQLGEIDQKIERQLAAIEAGVDPVVVGERIRSLKGEREEAQAVLQQLDQAGHDSTAVDPEDARTVLASLPDLAAELADADPELQRAVFEAFRLRVEIDRNGGRVHLRALVSSAFGSAQDLVDIGGAGTAALSAKAIPLPRSAPNGEIIVPVEAALDFAPQARKGHDLHGQVRVPRRDIPEEPT